MSLSLVLAAAWTVAVVASAPCAVEHSGRMILLAYVAAGIPLLGYMTYQNGPVAGLLGFAVGAVILGHPLLRLRGPLQWLRRRLRHREEPEH
ncbi:DUF2484 family protein [Tropicimonas sp. IMCC34043]|uniref:DUF2484 family protein n=1 Tax=Tropicimonas sp. IMCC34043 TaxID=2248760 RepID=UPI000E24B3F2|nr:DUF2484 family protein [Tropicimonas sp. IMCC34043]